MTSAITRLRLLGDSADELTKWQADVELRELEAKRKRERKEREACEQQQQQAANISQAWWDAIDQRIQQHWRHNLSVAHGADTSKPLDAYGALKIKHDKHQTIVCAALCAVHRGCKATIYCCSPNRRCEDRRHG